MNVTNADTDIVMFCCRKRAILILLSVIILLLLRYVHSAFTAHNMFLFIFIKFCNKVDLLYITTGHRETPLKKENPLGF